MAIITSLTRKFLEEIPARVLKGAANIGRGAMSGVMNTQAAAGQGLGYGAGRLAGTGVNRAGKYLGKVATDYREPFKEGSKKTLDALFTPGAAGTVGRELNPAIGNALEIGGVAVVIGGASTAGTMSQAQVSTPNAKMQGLGYGGGKLSSMNDDLGADGDLALALHYNRHG